jgi:O-antigen ligase
MKRYLTPFNIVFATEVIIVVLTALGLIPREAILALTGLMVFYMIFSPAEDALYLLIVSVPFFAALPISESFDTMANWRIMIAVLFLRLFFEQGILIKLKKILGSFLRPKAGGEFKRHCLAYLALLFLLIVALSILVADYKILAIKKLFFLISGLFIFWAIRVLVKDKESIIKIFRAVSIAMVSVIAVGAIQLFAVLFVPLCTFWQFWAGKVINALYGQNLAHLLSYSNTWFAYYAVNPPTLRIFSVFPDSHSFAMFLILGMPFFLALAVYYEKKDKQSFIAANACLPDSRTRNRPSSAIRKKIFWWAMTGMMLGGIILSGSRGAWLSILPVIVAVLYVYRKKIEPVLAKKNLLVFGLFVAIFLLSNFYPFFLYKFQSWQAGSSASSTFSFFERAKSISDVEEASNKGRLEIWRASFKSLIKYPILGVGFGNYTKVLGEDISAARKGASAHNLYLDFANEIGIFGALILIVIFLGILHNAWLVFRRATEIYFKAFGLFFCLYFLWVIVYSLFDVVLLNDKVLLLFLVELGTLFSIRKWAEKNQPLEAGF